MLEVDVDQSQLKKIEKKLGDSKDQAKQVLKKAINETAKQAKKHLAKEAQKTYVVKAGRFGKAMKQINATESSLEATIKSTGSAMELKDFKVVPASFRTGHNRPEIVKGKVLASGGLKRLEKGGIKAFVGKYASGHTTVMQRQGTSRLPVKTLYSPSIPMMLGNKKRVYGIVEPLISEDLQQNIQKHISKVLG